MQVVLDGQTVQQSSIYQNIATQYKVLTEWSQDEIRKWGPTLGIELDTYDMSYSGTKESSIEKLETIHKSHDTICIKYCDVMFCVNKEQLKNAISIL